MFRRLPFVGALLPTLLGMLLLLGLIMPPGSKAWVLSPSIGQHSGNCGDRWSQQKGLKTNGNEGITTLAAVRDGSNDDMDTRDAFCLNQGRRRFLGAAVTGASAAAAVPGTSRASDGGGGVATFRGGKSRTEGYPVQRTEREWAYVLSGPQYNILRRGGTERQKSSILNTFSAANAGSYVCAACPEVPLFASAAKFNSGTGWPSFASALPSVEAEAKDPVSATLGGREVRCASCGGHLGDLFNDGWVYPGTQAFATGNRFCIDGAALIFRPEGDNNNEGLVYGDQPPPNKVINYEPAIFRDNSINGRLQQ